ncbi:hypothetical protein Pan44_02650 [Caulifigura coniformis]|uniref:Uncharacterized protein n=1 Tax=Caulifigura coniformis TaxID=2527983 RepID=A0A517S811_9PLAN|nr:hypothetical protein Pan44_02650 [Caulifigura coniformis]
MWRRGCLHGRLSSANGLLPLRGPDCQPSGPPTDDERRARQCSHWLQAGQGHPAPPAAKGSRGGGESVECVERRETARTPGRQEVCHVDSDVVLARDHALGRACHTAGLTWQASATLALAASRPVAPEVTSRWNPEDVCQWHLARPASPIRPKEHAPPPGLGKPPESPRPVPASSPAPPDISRRPRHTLPISLPPCVSVSPVPPWSTSSPFHQTRRSRVGGGRWPD